MISQILFCDCVVFCALSFVVACVVCVGWIVSQVVGLDVLFGLVVGLLFVCLWVYLVFVFVFLYFWLVCCDC